MSLGADEIDPFTLWDDDLFLAVLLRANNSPQWNDPRAQEYLSGLLAEGYLRNTSRSSSPWWRLTKRGKAVYSAFVNAYGPEKEGFLRRTYNVLP